MEPQKGNNQAFQLIDNELDWQPGLTNYLTKHGLSKKSNTYKIVSIMGAQSTGKSTLLNSLFSTHFQEMDLTTQRSQTTKGVSVQTNTSGKKPILVFDVEGTDSEERKDLGDRFEKMLCTLALVASDVLIVNMWVTDVGRKVGSSMELLNSILRLNLQVFKEEVKPKSIYIVLRDCSPQENTQELAKKFAIRLNDVFVEIKKDFPDLNVALENVLKYKLLFLPHKQFQESLFQTQIQEMQRHFFSGNAFDNTSKTAVPLSGFEKYLENIWNKIKSDKAFDIPNEKALITEYFCERAFEESLKEIETEFQTFKDECEKALVGERFQEVYTELSKKALEKFEAHVYGYDEETCEKYQQNLCEKIGELFGNISYDQIELLINYYEEKVFAKEMHALIHSLNTIEQIQKECENVKTLLIEKFHAEVKVYKLNGETATDKEIRTLYNALSTAQVRILNEALEELERRKKAQEADAKKNIPERVKPQAKEQSMMLIENDENFTIPNIDDHDEEEYKQMLEELADSNLQQSQNANGSHAIYPCKKDGTPDMRYSMNREVFLKDAGCPKTKSGAPDMRYSVNRETLLNDSGCPLTKSGELDMRYSVNKEQYPKDIKLKKDGTPDMRCKKNKELFASGQLKPSMLKKDGTPDMRFKANKEQASVN